MKGLIRRNLAFTLAESIVACFIISVVILALFEIFPGSLLAMNRASMTVHASSLAESALDNLRAQGFNSLVVGSVNTTVVTLDKIDYTCNTTVTSVYAPRPGGIPMPVTPPLNPAMLSITAKVTWVFRGQNYNLTRESWMTSVKT